MNWIANLWSYHIYKYRLMVNRTTCIELPDCLLREHVNWKKPKRHRKLFGRMLRNFAVCTFELLWKMCAQLLFCWLVILMCCSLFFCDGHCDIRASEQVRASRKCSYISVCFRLSSDYMTNVPNNTVGILSRKEFDLLHC